MFIFEKNILQNSSQFIQVGQLSELTQLDLSSNQFTKFPLLKANNLKKLNVQTNPLENIQNISSCLLNSLQELRLSECKLGTNPFPKLNLIGLKTLYIYECQITDISNLVDSVLPLIEDINFSNNFIVNLPVLKLPLLKFLRLNSNSLESIMSLQQSDLPELSIIELQTNKITCLPYLPFPNLTKIFIHQNDISDVSGFNRSPAKNFQILNICQNPNLKDFPMLQGKFAEIYGNQTLMVDVSRIKQYKFLKKLQLNNNNITQIPNLNQPLLEMIQFQDNLLQNIDEFAKGEYNLCTQFSMKGNKLKFAPRLNMTGLKRVYFNQNQIEDAQQFLKSDMPDLRMISFEKNKLKKLSNVPFSTLEQIYLSSNLQLDSLKCFNLKEYSEMRMLVCATTGIKHVQILPKMGNLDKIWLNSSKLQDLEWLSRSAQNLPNLNFFAAPGNKISSLPIMKFKSLNTIYLYDNPISNVQRFLTSGQGYLSRLYTIQISLKVKSDEQFNIMSEKITAQVIYCYPTRYQSED